MSNDFKKDALKMFAKIHEALSNSEVLEPSAKVIFSDLISISSCIYITVETEYGVVRVIPDVGERGGASYGLQFDGAIEGPHYVNGAINLSPRSGNTTIIEVELEDFIVETFEERARLRRDLFENLYGLREEFIGLVTEHQSGLARTKTINPILTEFEYTMHAMGQPLFNLSLWTELFTMKAGGGLHCRERGDISIKVLYEHEKIHFVGSYSKMPDVQYKSSYFFPAHISYKNFHTALATFLDSFIHEVPPISEVPF